MSVVFAPQEDTPVSCCGSVTGLVIFALWCFMILYDFDSDHRHGKREMIGGEHTNWPPTSVSSNRFLHPLRSVSVLFCRMSQLTKMRCHVFLVPLIKGKIIVKDTKKQKYPIVFKEHGTGSTGCDLCVIIDKSSISIEPQRASPWTPARQNRQAGWEKILV